MNRVPPIVVLPKKLTPDVADFRGFTGPRGFAKGTPAGPSLIPCFVRDGSLLAGRAALRRRRSLFSHPLAGREISRRHLGGT